MPQRRPKLVVFPQNSLKGFIQRNFWKMSLKEMAEKKGRSLDVIRVAKNGLYKSGFIPSRQEVAIYYLSKLKKHRIKKTRFEVKEILGIKNNETINRHAVKVGYTFIRQEPRLPKPRISLKQRREFFLRHWIEIMGGKIKQSKLASDWNVDKAIVSRGFKAIKREKGFQ
ncbi:MAG: hypothetical protein Q7S21_04055 [archaeon]|nr:hypothetical protein [archaeon]